MTLWKWQALGNDYLLLEQADLPEPLSPDTVRRLCDYHYGVGSDGLLEVVASDGAHADLRIWNPDGSIAELSGNGLRIAAAWLARRSGVDAVTVAVGARTLAALVRADGNVELEVGPVDVGETERLEREPGARPSPGRRPPGRARQRRPSLPHRPGRGDLPGRARLAGRNPNPRRVPPPRVGKMPAALEADDTRAIRVGV